MVRTIKNLLRIDIHNNRPKGITILFAFVAILVVISCKDKKEADQLAPEIAFEGYHTIKSKLNNSDSLLIVSIQYKDVNGDIGLTLYDTNAPYNSGIFQYNLLVDIFDADNGREDTIRVFGQNNAQVFHQRIPDLRPTGKSKYIEGTISVTYDASKLTLYPNKLKMYIQMIDRKLNLSNKVDAGFIYLVH